MNTNDTIADISKLTIDRSTTNKTNHSFSIKSLIVLAAVILSSNFYWFTNQTKAEESQAGVINLVTGNTLQGSASQVSASQGDASQEQISQHDSVASNLLSLNTTSPEAEPVFPSKTNDQANTKLIMSKVLDASGHIVARRVATVSSRVTGKLELLHIEEGQRVVKGQVLAELDNQQAKISYQLALAELTAKQADYDELKILQQYENQRFARREQLAKNKLISIQLSDDSQLKTKQINVQLRNRKAMIDLAQQRVELALYHLKHHKIRAPFTGIVIAKNAQVGELISTGSSAGGSIRTGVGTVVDMDSLEIEVEVGESYINRVYAGQAVTATLDAYPQWQIRSEVITVIPTADRQKASIKVRIKLLETDERIFPDMGIKVSFLSNQI